MGALKRLLSGVVAAVAVCLAGSCSDGTLADRVALDKVTPVEKGDPEMERAFAKARATLDTFLKLSANPKPGTRDFSVKVAVRDGEYTEYFWLTPFSRDADGFLGTINNEPRGVRNVQFGQEFRFTRDDIFDWTYSDAEGRMYGGYTTCALLTHEPAQEAQAFRDAYSLDCNY
jgi:uncharacterized protein YegJ (DUF2314 family)